MGMTHNELLELMNTMTPKDKAYFAKAISAANTLASGGKMPPKQAKVFLDWVIKETKLSDIVRVESFDPEEMKIEKIDVGERVIMAADEGQDPGRRRGVKPTFITLHPEEFIVPWEITKTFLEINTEGVSVDDHIARLMATRAANNFEQLYLQADKAGPAQIEGDLFEAGADDKYILDTAFAKINGWGRLADEGHIVDAGGESVNADMFNLMLDRMPTKYEGLMDQFVTLVAPSLWRKLMAKVATRQGNLGDAALEGKPVKLWGMTFLPVPLWPLHPLTVENINLPGETEIPLRYTHITDVVVTPSTINGQTAINPYTEDVDYAVDYAAGRINRIGAGAISDNQLVKITYRASAQAILTHRKNLIIAFGRRIELDRDKEIFRRVRQYVLTMKVDTAIQNTDMVVKLINIGD